jgi:HK97 family phage major capsid protein
MAWIEQELPSRTVDNIAQQLLYGAGTTGKSLQGFMTYTGAQTYLWSEGQVGDNRIDAILRAALKVIGGTPTIVMNKRDFALLRLQKDKNENYLLSATIGKVSLEMVGGTWVLDGQYPIIESEAVIDNDFLVCDFKTASKLIDAEDEALEWGVINDDFALNQRRARYERTLAHAVQRLKSFVVCQWDNAPVA